MLTSTRSGVLCICSGPAPSGTNTQDFYFCWMLEQDAAIQLNLALSRQEVTHRNNNPVTFQNKTHKSKKRQTQALLLILRLETLHVVVFITHTYNCGHEWLCDLSWKLLGLTTYAVGRSAPWLTQNSTGGGCQTADSGHWTYQFSMMTNDVTQDLVAPEWNIMRAHDDYSPSGLLQHVVFTLNLMSP